MTIIYVCVSVRDEEKNGHKSYPISKCSHFNFLPPKLRAYQTWLLRQFSITIYKDVKMQVVNILLQNIKHRVESSRAVFFREMELAKKDKKYDILVFTK